MLSKKQGNIKYGDVVTYSENDYLVTHRIEQEDDDKIITKGDNNNEQDGQISKTRILGKVIYSSLFLGRFIQVYLKYILIVATMIIAFINIYWSFKERKKDGKTQKNSK